MTDERDDLLKVFMQRSGGYEGMVLKGVLLKQGEALVPIAMVYTALPKGTNLPEYRVHDYGKYVFMEVSEKPSSFAELCRKLGQAGHAFEIPDCGISVPPGMFRFANDYINKAEELGRRTGHTASLGNDQLALLREWRSYPQSVCRKWPTRTFLYEFNRAWTNVLREDIDKPLPAKPGLPVMPSLHAALGWWFEGDTEYDEGFIRLHLPSFAARIAEVQLSHDRFIVRTEIDENVPAALHLRYYVRHTGGRASSGVAEVSGVRACEIPLRADMRRLYVALTPVNGDTCIDYRDYDWESWNPAGLDYVADSEDIEMRIQQGENETTEFKLILGDGDEFRETVVSFSNTQGGIVILGVDNRGNIKGIPTEEAAKQKDRVVDLIRNWIEPYPTYKVEPFQVQGVQLLAVTVARGASPPYIYRGRGCFIRAGATDRIASHEEHLALARGLARKV